MTSQQGSRVAMEGDGGASAHGGPDQPAGVRANEPSGAVVVRRSRSLSGRRGVDRIGDNIHLHKVVARLERATVAWEIVGFGSGKSAGRGVLGRPNRSVRICRFP